MKEPFCEVRSRRTNIRPWSYRRCILYQQKAWHRIFCLFFQTLRELILIDIIYKHLTADNGGREEVRNCCCFFHCFLLDTHKKNGLGQPIKVNIWRDPNAVIEFGISGDLKRAAMQCGTAYVVQPKTGWCQMLKTVPSMNICHSWICSVSILYGQVLPVIAMPASPWLYCMHYQIFRLPYNVLHGNYRLSMF